MANNQITKSELALDIRQEAYECGTYLHYVGCQDKELYRIVERLLDTSFNIARIDLPSFEQKEIHQINLMSLKQYYRVVSVDIDRLHGLAMRVLDGEELEDLGGGTDDDTTSLMHLETSPP